MPTPRTPRPTRQNLTARTEHDEDGYPTGRVMVYRVTEEKRARGWEIVWDTQEPLTTLDTADTAVFIANLGRSLADATRPVERIERKEG